MKAVIWTSGDRSAGINGQEITVDLGGAYDDDDEFFTDKGSRDGLRRNLKNFFENYMDGFVRVQFSDELKE